MAQVASPKIKRALVSVSNKKGITEFCSSLSNDFGVEIISTGGTLKTLVDSGIKAVEISQYTGFPEIMDGRVKTLHPKVHGGILSRREIDKKVIEFKQKTLEPESDSRIIMEDVKDYLSLKMLLSRKLGRVVGNNLS